MPFRTLPLLIAALQDFILTPGTMYGGSVFVSGVAIAVPVVLANAFKDGRW